jgi:hypothetical protein
VVRELEAGGVAVLLVGHSLEAPVDAEGAREALRRLNDPRFDHHLRLGDVRASR